MAEEEYYKSRYFQREETDKQILVIPAETEDPPKQVARPFLK